MAKEAIGAGSQVESRERKGESESLSSRTREYITAFSYLLLTNLLLTRKRYPSSPISASGLQRGPLARDAPIDEILGHYHRHGVDPYYDIWCPLIPLFVHSSMQFSPRFTEFTLHLF
jgi:hypothetical protein